MKSLIPILAFVVAISASSCNKGGKFSCDCVTTMTDASDSETFTSNDVFDTSKESRAEEKCNEFKENINSSSGSLPGVSATTTCDLNKIGNGKFL